MSAERPTLSRARQIERISLDLAGLYQSTPQIHGLDYLRKKSQRGRHMTESDTWPQLLNHDAADQAAHAVQEVDPHQHQMEQEHKHPELVETRQEIKGTEGVLDLEQVLVQILEQMARLLPLDTASIQLLNPGSSELAIIASKGFDDPADVGTLAFPLEDTYPNVRVWRRKMPLSYPDVREHFPHFADPKYHATQVRGWLGAPLVVGDRVIGVITLDSFTPDSYTPQHEQLAMVFASQAAIAIQNARLFDSAQRRIRDLEIVNDIAQIIGTKLDTQDLLKAIVSQIADKLKCTHCTLFFPQKEKGELLLVPQVTHGVRGEQIMTRRFKPGDGLAGWVFQHGESLALPDAKQDPRFSSAREHRERPRSMLVAPVKVGDRTIGVISADQDEFNWFSESDRRLVDALARQAGIAIERAAALELLHDIGKRIISEQDVDEILQQIVRGAIELTDTTSGVIYLVSEDGKSVVSSYQHPPEFHHPKPRLAREEGITRQVIATGTEIIFPDIHQDPRVNPVLLDRVRSMIAVPLKLDERKGIGVLYLNDANLHSFTETEVSLLSTLATEAAIAIVNARLLQNTSEALKKRVAEMETLQEINEAITSTLELDTILEMILDRALGLTKASCGTVRLISEDGQELVLKSAQGATLASIGERLKLGEGVTGMAAQDSRAYRISDVQSPRWAHIHCAGIPGKRSELAVPMRFEGQVVGVISLESADTDAFSDDDERLLVGLARQAAIAIQNAHLYDSAKRRIRDLEIVNDIAEIIGTKLDTQDLLKAIASQIADKLNCAHCTLFFPQKEKDELLLAPQVTHGVHEEIMTRRFKLGEGLAGWVFQHGESLVLPDAKQDPRFSPARYPKDRPRSILVAPIKVGDQTIGVISADQDEFGWFSESDRRLVDALARQAGIAIERATALELVYNIGNQIIGAKNVADILQQIVSGAIKLTNTTAGVIHLISEDGKSVVNSFQHPPDFDLPKPRLAKEEGITRQVFATGEMMVFSDIRQDAHVNPVLHARFRSMIVAPLKLDERKVIGVLYLNDADPHSFTETEISLLSTLATQAAIAIQNAKQYEALCEAQDELLASGAIAWMGLFGSEWSHTVAQKTYSIRNYVDILRDITVNGNPVVEQALDNIDVIAQEIQDVPLVIPSPADTEKGKPVLIDSLVRKLIEGWCKSHDRVHLELDLRCRDALVRVDEPLLKMALQKLVDNAIRHMPGGGTLRVESYIMAKEYVAIALEDTGCGIPDEYKPFFGRRRISKSRVDSGSGMGALLARFILRKYNGDLELVWSEKDEGTRLEITLPIYTSERDQ
jgi:GAF domain-containing protein